jgi:glycosyltransferase involved in cell wall biosynthesis
MSRKQTPRVSLAIPVYNEEEVVPELIERCLRVLDETPGGPHEMIVVDDGSRDRTLEQLYEAAQKDPRILVIELSRNFGHQAAISAALAHVEGDVILVMDGDLQDPPEELPRFLELYRQGYDVIFAQRKGRKESWWLRASYFLFYRTITALSDIDLPLDSGDNALLTRRVVDEIVRAPESHRYLRGLRTWVGFRQIGLEVERHERAGGTPKYTTWKLLGLALNGIFAFSTVPLRLASLIGFLAISAAGLFTVYAIYVKMILDRSPAGFTAQLTAIVFLAGVQMVFLGVLGEYIGRIYHEVKRRPQFIVCRLSRSPDGS